MCERFIEYYDIFGQDNGNSEARRRRTSEWVRSKKSRIKKQAAWYDLFGMMKLEQIVTTINSTWIDPAYEIVMGIRRVKTIQIVEKRKK